MLFRVWDLVQASDQLPIVVVLAWHDPQPLPQDLSAIPLVLDPIPAADGTARPAGFVVEGGLPADRTEVLAGSGPSSLDSDRPTGPGSVPSVSWARLQRYFNLDGTPRLPGEESAEGAARRLMADAETDFPGALSRYQEEMRRLGEPGIQASPEEQPGETD